MKKLIHTVIALLAVFLSFGHSLPRPSVEYILKVGANALTGFDVEMRIKNITSTFRLAMTAHPEYDDRYWRYVQGLNIETTDGKATIIREDSALWRVTIPGKDAIVRYHIQLPKDEDGQRAAWRPFLSATGGLTGGPHTFMYIVGYTKIASTVKLDVPKGWKIVTGLDRTKDPSLFHASSVAMLVDCPFLLGKLKQWDFSVMGIKHHVVYWLLPDAKPVDSVKLVDAIKKIVEQAAAVFGKLPYNEYSFLLQDGAYGALEHANNVTLGIPTANLKEKFADYLNEIAHEYFHNWNLVRIHPVEYGDVSYIKQPLSKGLWFSEGFTMFYATLMPLRAGLPLHDSGRLGHLEWLLRRYYNSPGNRQISPETISLAEYGPPGMLGDYTGSPHLQGEWIATILDLIIRDATNGKRSLDDVMREMMKRFSGEKGFTSKDIEEIVSSISGADVHPFFVDHVYGNKEIDLNKYIRLAGFEFDLGWRDAIDREGRPAADLRIYTLDTDDESIVRLAITDPGGIWGNAGVHTGDRLTAMNGVPIQRRDDFWRLIRKVQLGDTVKLQLLRPSGHWQTTVVVGTYKQAVIRLRQLDNITERQMKLRREWTKGK